MRPRGLEPPRTTQSTRPLNRIRAVSIGLRASGLTSLPSWLDPLERSNGVDVLTVFSRVATPPGTTRCPSPRHGSCAADSLLEGWQPTRRRFTASLGYATEAALVRAFKRERGETLGAHRAGARGTPRVELAVSAG